MKGTTMFGDRGTDYTFKLTDERGRVVVGGASGSRLTIRTYDPDGDVGPVVELSSDDALTLAATILRPYGLL